MKIFIFLLLSLNVFALQFHNSEETLDKIVNIIAKKEKGAYFRFGDGDVVLANGQNDSYQKFNVSLQREMREAFSLNGENILKCLPLGCKEMGGWEKGMFPGNHEQPYEWCLEMIGLAAPLWNGEMNDVYSMTALAHCATNRIDLCMEFLQFLKRSNCCLFVGNGKIPSSLIELLFGPQCQFIQTPSDNSYDAIDRIEQECLEASEAVLGYKLIVTSMGCSGRALQKRLWHKLDNVFLFDFGSLMDAICGWNTRDWIGLTYFNEHRFLKKLHKNLDTIVPQNTGKVRIVCTSALIEPYESRRREYIDVLNLLEEYGYKPYVFEACHLTPPSFLEDYTPHVFYSSVNDSRLNNKGVNEARSMIEGFKHYHFADNDTIIKLTGRYLFDNRNFIHLVETHPEVDMFVKCDPGHHIPFGKAFTGCYAMRFNLFKEMLQNLDLVKMEKEMIDIEVEVAHFAKKLADRGDRVMYVDQIGISANIGGSFPPVFSQW